MSKGVENIVGKKKLLVTSNFLFSYSVFKRLLLQTRKKKDLFGKGSIVLNLYALSMYYTIVTFNDPEKGV